MLTLNSYSNTKASLEWKMKPYVMKSKYQQLLDKLKFCWFLFLMLGIKINNKWRPISRFS